MQRLPSVSRYGIRYQPHVSNRVGEGGSDDDQFVEGVWAGKATCVVSGDQYLLASKKYPSKPAHPPFRSPGLVTLDRKVVNDSQQQAQRSRS